MALEPVHTKSLHRIRFMSQITLDPNLKARLNGLNEKVEVLDETGKLVGAFLPAEAYLKYLYATVEIPFTPEEIERRRQETGGCSLADIWKRLGVE
jgi:hypothetical protein